MTTWVFDGVTLPGGERRQVEAGSGEQQPLPGRFALPGLVDAHCHLTVGSDDRGPLLLGRDVAEARMQDLVRQGVTSLRDTGGDRTITLSLAARRRPGDPAIVACGRFLAPQGRYFPRMHDPVQPEELVEAIEAEIDDGATWVKLIGDFPSTDGVGVVKGTPIETTYSLDIATAAVEAAHGRGARVAAHTNGQAVSSLVRAGVDSVEHGTVITAEDLRLLGERGGAWTPTLGASVLPGRRDSAAAATRRRAMSQHLTAMLPLAVEYGVRILTGSDVVGNVVQEIALLVEHGLSVDDALTAASGGGRGYLRCGDEHDLVTYDDDPRERPEALRQPAAVVVRGHRIG